MRKYDVTRTITVRYSWVLEADSFRAAEAEAREKGDFGAGADVVRETDWKATHACSEVKVRDQSFETEELNDE